MADLSTQIETDAATAKRMKAGDKEKESRPLSELIEADKYLANKSAVGSFAATFRGITSRITPPGGH